MPHSTGPALPLVSTMSRSPFPRSSDVELPQKSEGHSRPEYSPEFEAEIAAAAPRLSGHKLTAAIAFVAGTGFTLFGCVSCKFGIWRRILTDTPQV